MFRLVVQRLRAGQRAAAAAVASAVAGTAALAMQPLASSCEAADAKAADSRAADIRAANNSSRFVGIPLTSSTIADAAAKVAPATVNIVVTTPGVLATVQHGGSGFIVEESGTILTNSHVVRDALVRGRRAMVMVTLHDGITKLRGVVEYADVLSDVAIVRVNPAGPLPTARLGSSTELRPGDFVMAMGAPAGLTNSVSLGIVSSIERTRSELGMRGSADGRDTTVYIQTDAAINAGNSGGPLINIHGEVVGVNSMKALGLEGIAFAIQIDEIKRVMRQLALHGRVLRPYLGLRFFELTPHLAANINERVNKEKARKAGADRGVDQKAGAGDDQEDGWEGGKEGGAHDVLLPPTGLHVMHVAPDSPAQHAGVNVGDTIVGLRAGQAEPAVSIASTKHLVDRLADHVGGQVELEVWRDGRPGRWLNIKVESMPS